MLSRAVVRAAPGAKNLSQLPDQPGADKVQSEAVKAVSKLTAADIIAADDQDLRRKFTSIGNRQHVVQAALATARKCMNNNSLSKDDLVKVASKLGKANMFAASNFITQGLSERESRLKRARAAALLALQQQREKEQMELEAAMKRERELNRDISSSNDTINSTAEDIASTNDSIIDSLAEHNILNDNELNSMYSTNSTEVATQDNDSGLESSDSDSEEKGLTYQEMKALKDQQEEETLKRVRELEDMLSELASKANQKQSTSVKEQTMTKPKTREISVQTDDWQPLDLSNGISLPPAPSSEFEDEDIDNEEVNKSTFDYSNLRGKLIDPSTAIPRRKLRAGSNGTIATASRNIHRKLGNESMTLPNLNTDSEGNSSSSNSNSESSSYAGQALDFFKGWLSSMVGWLYQHLLN